MSGQAYQRRGFGHASTQCLSGAVAARTASGSFVSLLAGPQGVRMHESRSFQVITPASVGMFRRFAQVPGEHP